MTARNIDLREEAIPAIRRAFELEGRVSQPERFFIEGVYYRLVAGDAQKAIETHQAWKRMYPGSALPPNAIASMLSDELGQYEAAVAEAREAVRLAPYSSAPYNNQISPPPTTNKITNPPTIRFRSVRRCSSRMFVGG